MDRIALGKKLRKARENCGLNQDAVELALQLPQKAITRIESGERNISTLELTQLAALYHKPIGDFFSDSKIEDEDLCLVLHRLAPGIEINRKINEEIARYIHICREAVSLKKLLHRDSESLTCSYSSTSPLNARKAIEEGERAAEGERKRLGIGNAPIGEIATLFSSQGIWCAGSALLPEISGLFLHHSTLGRVILVNTTHAQVRQRFSFAHEYAHALFDQTSNVLISDDSNASNLIEKRANAFAAAFLLPKEGVLELVCTLGKGRSSRTIHSVFDEAREEIFETEERHIVQRVTPTDVAIIARNFNVSYQATVYRLNSLQIINKKERETLLAGENEGKKYLELVGYSPESSKIKNEPPQNRELKTYISQLIIDAYRHEAISRGRFFELCKLLDISAQELFIVAEDNL